MLGGVAVGLRQKYLSPVMHAVQQKWLTSDAPTHTYQHLIDHLAEVIE